MKVYVGTYAKYNSGNLAGAWLHLGDYEDWNEFIAVGIQLHEDERDPELMFQDWDDDGLKGSIGESFVDPAIWQYLDLDESDQNKAKALLWNGNTLEESVTDPDDKCNVIECTYESEAESKFFDWWCEMNHEVVSMLQKYGSYSIVGYLDQSEIWNDYQAQGFVFIKDIGIVEFF